MKNNNLKKFRVSAVLLLSLPLIMFSCLKDKGPIQDFSHSPALVGFQFKGNEEIPLFTSLLGNADDQTEVEITLSVASLTLNTPVSVTVTPDDAALATYNAANGTSYIQLDPSLYTLANGGVVTINPGEQIVNLTINFAGDQIDFNQDNALALTITNVQGAIIATNLNTAILPLKLKNPYEGTYTVTGYFVHPTSPRAIALTNFISTISVVRSESQFADLGGWTFQWDVAPDNTLTNYHATGLTYPEPQSGFMTVINPTGNATYPGPPYTDPPYNNTYDPATHTFWMHYGYGASATGQTQYSREVFEKWVLQ